MKNENKVGIEEFLYLNNPLKLAIVGYFLNPEFIASNRSIILRQDAHNMLSTPELERMLKEYYPASLDRKTILNNIKAISKAGFAKVRKDERLVSGERQGKYRRNHYELIDTDISALARLVLHQIALYKFDYEKIAGYVQINGNRTYNTRRWDLIDALAEKNRTMGELISITGITSDRIYDHLCGLYHAGMIHMPFKCGEERLLRFRFNSAPLEGDTAIVLYSKFGDREFTVDDAKKVININESTLKRKVYKLEERGILESTNKHSTNSRFYLTPNAKIFRRDVMMHVRSYFGKEQHRYEIPLMETMMMAALKQYEPSNGDMYADALSLVQCMGRFTLKKLANMLEMTKVDHIISRMQKEGIVIDTGERVSTAIVYGYNQNQS